MLHFIYCQPLWRIVLILLISPLLWAFLGQLIAHRRLRFWKGMNLLLAGISVLVILYATLGNRAEDVRQVVLTPFASFSEAKIQPELYRSMLMNVLLFEPLGLSLSQGLPVKQSWLRVLLPVLFALCLSCTIEALQYLFFLGRTEADDVMMNTIGAMVGALSLPLTAFLKLLFSKYSGNQHA
ncbi:MAG: VanZ family protein [Oscillospiraceae bacterium]|nr:VanZ family protein [Oscillospiraceae bacterium]